MKQRYYEHEQNQMINMIYINRDTWMIIYINHHHYRCNDKWLFKHSLNLNTHTNLRLCKSFYIVFYLKLWVYLNIMVVYLNHCCFGASSPPICNSSSWILFYNANKFFCNYVFSVFIADIYCDSLVFSALYWARFLFNSSSILSKLITIICLPICFIC